jgi:hypothetical protein
MEIRCAYEILVGKYNGKQPFETQQRRLGNHIKMNVTTYYNVMK